jgi:metal-sulfur cluster biosynthetic enzyme
MQVPTGSGNRREEVWSALSAVTDPELDESITALEFITALEVEDQKRVRIEFRLPTFWCAPNFAFLMASDLRDAVAELPWVEDVSVKLLDHFSADLINRGVALKQDFRDAFPGETDDDLSELRKTFLRKAFEGRQELLLRQLLATGYDPVWITQVTLRELMRQPLDARGDGLRNLYVFMWRRIRPDAGEQDLAFTTADGKSLEPSEFRAHLRKVSGVRRNQEFNGLICRGLLTVRNAR